MFENQRDKMRIYHLHFPYFCFFRIQCAQLVMLSFFNHTGDDCPAVVDNRLSKDLIQVTACNHFLTNKTIK